MLSDNLKKFLEFKAITCKELKHFNLSSWLNDLKNNCKDNEQLLNIVTIHLNSFGNYYFAKYVCYDIIDELNKAGRILDFSLKV